MPTIDEHLKLLMQEKSTVNPRNKVTFDDLPEWYDEKLFTEGQNYYKRNIWIVIISTIMGMFAIFSVPQILKIVIYSNQGSRPRLTPKRLIEIMLHIHILYTCNPSDPISDWYQSINVINWRHKIVSEKSKNAGVGEIYQRDMAITQFCFAGYIFIAEKSIGLRVTSNEREAFNHFWRVTGYMLGIPDRLNLCRETATESRELYQKVASNILANYLKEAPPAFHEIVSTISHGIRQVNVTFDKDAFLAFVYQQHGIEYVKPLGWYSWLNAKHRDLIFYLLLVPYIGVLIRSYYNGIIKIAFWLVQKWWRTFEKDNLTGDI